MSGMSVSRWSPHFQYLLPGGALGSTGNTVEGDRAGTWHPVQLLPIVFGSISAGEVLVLSHLWVSWEQQVQWVPAPNMQPLGNPCWTGGRGRGGQVPALEGRGCWEWCGEFYVLPWNPPWHALLTWRGWGGMDCNLPCSTVDVSCTLFSKFLDSPVVASVILYLINRGWMPVANQLGPLVQAVTAHAFSFWNSWLVLVCGH